jgi:hypothetical protein
MVDTALIIALIKNKIRKTIAVFSSFSLSNKMVKFPVYDDIKVENKSNTNETIAKTKLMSQKSNGKNIIHPSKLQFCKFKLSTIRYSITTFLLVESVVSAALIRHLPVTFAREHAMALQSGESCI